MTGSSGAVAFDPAALFARLGVMPRRITADSRSVEPGSAFAAYRGQQADGRAYIADAIGRGATAVLWDPDGFRWNDAWSVANVAVDALRPRLGPIADYLYGAPSRSLSVIGVTGTNGKTSCAHWIAQCLERCGRRAAVVGTLGNGPIGALRPTPNTTPDAARVHEMLAEFRAAGIAAVAMEVSSHGLDQGRVNAVRFDTALFTNLTRDHLDYHGTMEAYGAAKAKLFAQPGLRSRVIHVGDAFGRRLAAEAKARGERALTYGLAGADIVATRVASGAEGIALSVATPWGAGDAAMAVYGEFNVINALGVLGVLLEAGIGIGAALAALARASAPAGRMQRLGGGSEPLVVVDYAHSPDALAKVLAALRPAVAGDRALVCVFGCGGDRDAGKRPQMGRIAAELADRVIVTSDNPRNEDPAAIVEDIVRGIPAHSRRRHVVELDRANAIAAALAGARDGDVVLIAGKGHEDYQERRGVRAYFSDVEVAARALERRGHA
jgi:UDP-N-acetylmuramoyl-L-alanyl-D-glutamate--2,6-diaminopimelate ligase